MERNKRKRAVWKKIKASEVEADSLAMERGAANDIDMEDGGQRNPEVVDALTVAEMFAQIKRDMASMKAELKEDMKAELAVLKDTPQKVEISEEIVESCVSRVVEQVKTNQDIELPKIKQELKHFKYRNRALTDVVERLTVEVSDLKIRLENIELANAKGGNDNRSSDF